MLILTSAWFSHRRPPRDLDSKACVTIGDQVKSSVVFFCAVPILIYWCVYLFIIYIRLLSSELCGESRWPGADCRVGEGSVWRGGQDETCAQWCYHGCQGRLGSCCSGYLVWDPCICGFKIVLWLTDVFNIWAQLVNMRMRSEVLSSRHYQFLF